MRPWVISLLLLLPGMGAGYMTWLSARIGSDGKWLFGVFAGFFLLLAATPHLKQKAPQKTADSPQTRFVSHWFMLVALLFVAVAVVLAMTSTFLRR